jgi:hypothetical protein
MYLPRRVQVLESAVWAGAGPSAGKYFGPGEGRALPY